MEGFGEKIEDVWGRLEAKCEDDIVEELSLPGVSEEVPVHGSDWYVAESILEIEFRQECTAAEGPYCRDSMLEPLINNGPFRVGNPVINGGTLWPGEVVDAPSLGGAFAGY